MEENNMKNIFQKQINYMIFFRYVVIILLIFAPDLPPELEEIDAIYKYNLFNIEITRVIEILWFIGAVIIFPYFFWKNKIYSLYVFILYVIFLPIASKFNINYWYEDALEMLFASLDVLICCLIYIDRKYNLTKK